MESSSRAAASGWRLSKALLISAAIHLFALLAIAVAPDCELGEPGGTARQLQVLRLSAPRSVAAPVARAASAVNGPPVRHRPVLTAPSVVADPVPSVVPVPPSVVASGERNPAPAVTYEAAAPVNAAAQSASAVPTELTREPELPEGYADALRGYRVALARQAKRHRRYPPAAEEMGLGGLAEIEVVVPASALPELRIKKTSGHELLDQAALEMLRRSVGRIELPPPLKGRRFVVSLPVEFDPPR